MIIHSVLKNFVSVTLITLLNSVFFRLCLLCTINNQFHSFRLPESVSKIFHVLERQESPNPSCPEINLVAELLQGISGAGNPFISCYFLVIIQSAAHGCLAIAVTMEVQAPESFGKEKKASGIFHAFRTQNVNSP